MTPFCLIFVILCITMYSITPLTEPTVPSFRLI